MTDLRAENELLREELKKALTLGIKAAEESIIRRFNLNNIRVPRLVNQGLEEARSLVQIVEKEYETSNR